MTNCNSAEKNEKTTCTGAAAVCGDASPRSLAEEHAIVLGGVITYAIMNLS